MRFMLLLTLTRNLNVMRKVLLKLGMILLLGTQSLFCLGQNRNVDSLKRLLGELPDSAKMNIYHKLGSIYRSQGSDSCFYYTRQGLALAYALNDLHKQVELLNQLAINHYALHPDSSIFYAKKGIAIAEKNQDSYGKMQLQSTLSVLYKNRGDFKQAIDCSIQVLRLCESIQDTAGIAQSAHSLSQTYVELGEYPSALRYAQRAVGLYSLLRDTINLANSLGNQAHVYQKMEDWPNAIQINEQTLSLIKNKNLSHIKAGINFHLGQIYQTQGKNTLAKEKFLRVLTDVPNVYSKAVTLQALGEVEYLLNEEEAAEKYLLESIALAKEFEGLDILRANYETLTLLAEKRGNFAEALDYQRQAIAFKDSIYNQEKTKQIQEISTQYEVEKKEQAIALLEAQNQVQALTASRQRSWLIIAVAIGGLALLAAFLFYRLSALRRKNNLVLVQQKNEIQAKNEQITEQNQTIQQALAEKEILLKEIHHRVKNNLQIISSLMNIQARQIQQPAFRQWISEGQNRLLAMAEVHQNLYQLSNLSEVPFKPYVSELGSRLIDAYASEEDIHLAVEAENYAFKIDQIIPIGLIINELITNAVKYAFEDYSQAQIRIALQMTPESHYALEIADNGIGLPTGLFEDKQQQGTGWRLVHMLVRQLYGSIEHQNQPGARFQILFPA